jgi:hypothetical protein
MGTFRTVTCTATFALTLLAVVTTASSALAAYPTSRFKTAKPTAAARAKAQEAKGYLSPMPW